MKHRFSMQDQTSGRSGIVISIIFFLLVLSAFAIGIQTVRSKTDQQEIEVLEQAIERDILRCYSSTGAYPESLDVLREDYGLTYNEDHFYVLYRPIAANIAPDVTIIDRRKSQ